MSRRVSLFAALLFVLPGLARAEVLLDRVAAVVNGKVITLAEVQDRARLYSEMGAQDDTDTRTLEQQALDDLIDELVIEGVGIQITPDEVDRIVENTRRQNNLTEAQFDQALAAQGTSLAVYRQYVERQARQVRFLREHVGASITVTDEDVDNRLGRAKEFKVRHILLKVPQGADAAEVADVRRRVEALKARIEGGADFAEMAREVGEDGTASAGGELGWVGRGVMVKPFEEAIFHAPQGEVTGPVRTQFGWHLILVEDSRVGASDPAARARIRQQIEAEEMERQTRRVLDALRKKAVVEVKVEGLAS